MKITSLKNENGARVYHVADHDAGCIQEFWDYTEAQEYRALAMGSGQPKHIRDRLKETEGCVELTRALKEGF